MGVDSGDPQTLGEPCGYAIFKNSRNGRANVTDAEVLRRIAAAKEVAMNARTAAQRKADERQRLRDAGLVVVRVWIHADDRAKLAHYIRRLNERGAQRERAKP